MHSVKILLVDDEENLLQITQLYLEKTDRRFIISTAKSTKVALNLLVKEPFDIIISDYKMPEMDGLEFLAKVKDQGYDIPFIIFTGKGREEVAIQALNLGADYYLQKGGDPKSQFRELINLIEKSVEKRKSDISVRKSEEKFSKAFQFSLNGIAIIRFSDRVYLDVNENFIKTMGYSKEEIIGKKSSELNIWAKKEDYDFYFKQLIEVGEIFDFETLIVGKNGRIIPLQISATLIDIEGELCILSISRDVLELTQALEDSKENEIKYRLLFEESHIAMFNLNMFDVKKRFEMLKITDSSQFFGAIRKQPNLLTELISLIKILDVNKTAIELAGAIDRNNLHQYFTHEYIMKNIDLYSKLLLQLILGNTHFEDEISVISLKDEIAKIILRVSLAPGYEETWSKVFLSAINVTKRAQALINLRKERIAFKTFAEAAGSSATPKVFFSKILKGLADVLEYEYATIRILNTKTQLLEPVSSFGLDERNKQYLKAISIEDKNHKLVSNLLKKEVVFIPNAKKSPMKDSVFVKKLKTVSYVFCPLLDSKNSIMGSMQFSSREAKLLQEEDKIFFETIADMFSNFLEHKLKN